MESKEKFGRWGRVVERILKGSHRFRRLRIRYEQQTDIHQAFLSLAYAIICSGLAVEATIGLDWSFL